MVAEGLGDLRGEEVDVTLAEPLLIGDAELLGELLVIEDEVAVGVLDVAHEGTMIHEGSEDVVAFLEGGGEHFVVVEGGLERLLLGAESDAGFNLTAKDGEGVALAIGENTRDGVDDAKGAEGVAVRA